MSGSSLQRTIRRGISIVVIQLSVLLLLVNDGIGGMQNRHAGPLTSLAEETLALWTFWGAVFYLVGSILVQMLGTEPDGELEEREDLAD